MENRDFWVVANDFQKKAMDNPLLLVVASLGLIVVGNVLYNVLAAVGVLFVIFGIIATVASGVAFAVKFYREKFDV